MAENTTTMKALEIEGGDDLMDTTANPMIVTPDADDDSSTDSSEEGEAPNTMSSASAEFKKRISCPKLFGIWSSEGFSERREVCIFGGLGLEGARKETLEGKRAL